MKNLNIKPPIGRFDIPEIDFNYETGICEISGESFPEHTPRFYTPVVEWLYQYMFVEKKSIIINFKLHYFNTSSSKALYDLLLMFKKYQDEKGKIEVNWYYDKNDIDILEEIEDFIYITELKINTITN